MKKIISLGIVLLVGLNIVGCTKKEEPPAPPPAVTEEAPPPTPTTDETGAAGQVEEDTE